MMIANDVSLRNLIPIEVARGFGTYQSKPSSSFSPVAVTLDELGERVRIEVFGKDGQSVFGAIDQKVVRDKSAQ